MNDTAERRSIDDILAAIRAEIGEDPVGEVVEMREARRELVRVEMLEGGEAGVATDARAFTVDDFEALDEEVFLRTAYQVVLGREIDGSGFSTFLPALRDGQVQYVDVLRALRFSPEGEARGTQIVGLTAPSRLKRLEKIRKLRWLTEPLFTVLRGASDERRTRRRLARVSRQHQDMLKGVNASLASVRRSLANVEREAVEARALTQAAIDQRDEARAELESLRGQVTTQAKIIREFASRIGGVSLPGSFEGAATAKALDTAAFDAFYLAFENRFRGEQSVIAERQRRYIDLFRRTPAIVDGGTVLDIGCGRGEFLAELRDANIAAVGVDLSTAMIAEARTRGLDATEADGIAHLQAQGEASLAAITAFHVVEHLAFDRLIVLFDAAFVSLRAGGFVLFETPNPENLVVGACTFHLDPTHNKPIPPDLLRFVAETRGFTDIRIIRSADDLDLTTSEAGFAPHEPNDWFRQPPDYAIFARKPAAGSS